MDASDNAGKHTASLQQLLDLDVSRRRLALRERYKQLIAYLAPQGCSGLHEEVSEVHRTSQNPSVRCGGIR